MQLASGTHIPDGLLAANALLSEKLHQGSRTSTHTLHQGFGVAISSTSLGIIGTLYDGDVRSRCTGKERDTESGLDYFGARYYESTIGRFTSPDPLNLTNARLMNPSNTLNKYAYAGNNPLKYVDKDGRDITIFYEAPASSSPYDLGHIFVTAYNQESGAAATLSFGPRDGSAMSGFQALFGVPGKFDYERDPGAAASLTIRTNPEDANKIITAINDLMSGKTPDWSALGANCTTVVEAVLRDLGLDFGDLNPTLYWTHLFQSQSLLAKQTPFAAAFGPVPSQPGKDYGDPRTSLANGMQWSSFIGALSLLPAQDNSTVTTSQGDGKACGGNSENPCN